MSSLDAQKRQWLREMDRFRQRVEATDGPTTVREKQVHTRVANLLRRALRNYLALCRGLHIIDSSAVTLPSEIKDVLSLAQAELRAASYVPTPPKQRLSR